MRTFGSHRLPSLYQHRFPHVSKLSRKGFIGLVHGEFMTQIYHALYGYHSKSLLLPIAWIPSSILFLPFICLVKVSRQNNDIKIFYDLLYMSLGLAGFLMFIIIVQTRVHFFIIEYGGSAFVVLVLLFLPLLVITKQVFKVWKSQKQALSGPNSQLNMVTARSTCS